MEPEKERFAEVRGRDLITGLPKTIEVGSAELLEAVSKSLEAILDAIRMVLERTPPELSADIADKGMVLTGGGSLLGNLDILLTKVNKIPAYVAENPISCVALGAGRVLDQIHVLKQGLISSGFR